MSNGAPPTTAILTADDRTLEIILYTRGFTFDGVDPVDVSLGGAESAVVWISVALRRLGHRVTVFWTARWSLRRHRIWMRRDCAA